MSKITLGTPIAVIVASLLAAAGVDAQRAARSSVNVNRSASANVSRSASANVNRDTNVNVNQNTNVNVNRDADVNVNHYGSGYGYGCCYHPAGTAAAVAATAVATAAIVGSIVNTIPPSCAAVSVNGVSYQQCGSTWYRPQFAGSSVTYVVVASPR
jgi:hypothetical protein